MSIGQTNNNIPPKPERVLIFSLAYFPFVGGAEVAIKEITNRISSDDFEFDLITLRFNSELPKFEKIGNVNVYRIGLSKKNPSLEEMGHFPLYLTKVFYPMIAFSKATSLHMKNRYDMVWSVLINNGFPAVFFKWFNPKIPFLLTIQDGDTVEHLSGRRRIKLVGPLFKEIFRKADCIQTISNYLTDLARDFGYKGEVKVIPNGVDVSKFEVVNQEKIQDIKTELEKGDDFWLVTTSRLVEKNAVDDVIGALPMLPEEVKFLVIGDGPLEKELKDLAEELEVYDRVLFLGEINHSEISNYLHASDCFIRPSRSEGFGVSFVEAMAAKIPVIATDVGGIRDFLKHKETGLVCGLNDSNDIAHKVEMIMRDIDLREEIVDNAYKMVKEKYDWNLVSEEMMTLFKSL